MLKAITDMPGGAAASVVLLQDKSTDMPSRRCPRRCARRWRPSSRRATAGRRGTRRRRAPEPQP